MKAKESLVAIILLTAVIFLAQTINIPDILAQTKSYFYDRIGELMLVGESKDVYIEKIDGTERRKITRTPDIYELDAFFGFGGTYVVYKAEKKKSAFDKSAEHTHRYFMQPTDGDDMKRVEIDEFLYADLKKERIETKHEL